MTDSPTTVRCTSYLQAWQVTADNLADVAAWCGGVHTVADDQEPGVGLNPDRSTTGEANFARPSNYVMRATSGKFFVYTEEEYEWAGYEEVSA